VEPAHGSGDGDTLAVGVVELLSVREAVSELVSVDAAVREFEGLVELVAAAEPVLLGVEVEVLLDVAVDVLLDVDVEVDELVDVELVVLVALGDGWHCAT
jgi:hypothetical protein